jgi:F420H(2)-dependent quinone reductase
MAESASHAGFAVFNRTVNPIVSGLLRSPAHRLLSGRLALITVTGRVSGRSYTIPVLYERDGGTVRIQVGWPERKRWWRNLTGAGNEVTIRLGDEERNGFAIARGDETSGVTVEVTLAG